LAAVNLGAAFVAQGQMCTAVPLDAPWNAKMAAKWNRTTAAQWLGRNVPSRAAHHLPETAIAVRVAPDGLGRRSGLRARRGPRVR
jgi:monoamine oxidase